MAKQNKANNELLIGLYYNIKTSMLNITNVIEKVEDSRLKKLLKAQLDDYTRYQDTIEDLAQVYKIDVLDNSVFKKAHMWIMVNMAMFFDKSNRKIASMNIYGTTMGIIDLIGLMSDCKKACSEFISLANQILELEQSNIQALKPYLLKENQLKKSKQTPSNEQSKPVKNINQITPNKDGKNTNESSQDDLYGKE